MYLELIIEQNNEEDFQAKCPLFPKCKGRGSNKDEAIKNSVNQFLLYFKTNIIIYSRKNY